MAPACGGQRRSVSPFVKPYQGWGCRNKSFRRWGIKSISLIGCEKFQFVYRGSRKNLGSENRELVLQLDSATLEEINLTVAGENTLLIKDTVNQSARINLSSGTTDLGVLPSPYLICMHIIGSSFILYY